MKMKNKVQQKLEKNIHPFPKTQQDCNRNTCWKSTLKFSNVLVFRHSAQTLKKKTFQIELIYKFINKIIYISPNRNASSKLFPEKS
jgi:hypothetical protein